MGVLGLTSFRHHLDTQTSDWCLTGHELRVPVAGVEKLRKNFFNVLVHKCNYFQNPELKVKSLYERIMNSGENKRGINDVSMLNDLCVSDVWEM